MEDGVVEWCFLVPEYPITVDFDTEDAFASVPDGGLVGYMYR